MSDEDFIKGMEHAADLTKRGASAETIERLAAERRARMVPEPKVWHVNDPNCPPDAVYCGRPAPRLGLVGSPYANPYRVRGKRTRREAIELFCENVLPLLDVSALRGKHLKCWCAPQPCHCDAILRKANA